MPASVFWPLWLPADEAGSAGGRSLAAIKLPIMKSLDHNTVGVPLLFVLRWLSYPDGQGATQAGNQTS